jgi:hypothetical protein
MDLCYLSKLQLFIFYLNKNISKTCDMFKGGKKNCQASAIFIDIFCLLLFRAFVWVSRWLFLSILLFYECCQLNILYGNLTPNFIWDFFSSTYIIFMPSNVIHSRKEMRKCFVVKFFSQGRNNLQASSCLIMDNTISLGDPVEPPGPINFWVWILFQLCFSRTILLLHKLG